MTKTHRAIELRSARITVRKTNTHDKFFAIRGRYNGSNAVRYHVLTGSHNMTKSALRDNDELLVRLEDYSTYYAFRKHWERMTADEDAFTYP